MKLKSLVLAAMMLSASATLALASSGVDAAKDAQIRADLTAQGYDVRKIKMENGMIEVYALKDGVKFELYLDENLKIVKTGGED